MPTPRSYLYVPGDRPEILEKALMRSADALIIDLEDAVPASMKTDARRIVSAWLTRQDPDSARQIWVRVNPGRDGLQDVDAIAGIRSLYGVCMAKADSADDVRLMADFLDLQDSKARIMPLLESASAVLDARQIALAPRVSILQLGEADLAVDTGIEPGPTGDEFDWCRSMVVLASAAAGLNAPVAPVITNFRDLDIVRTSTRQLRRNGFFGRACIHPAQVGIVNEVFAADPDAVQRARELLRRSSELNTVTFTGPDGRMVDEAVLRAARRTLARG